MIAVSYLCGVTVAATRAEQLLLVQVWTMMQQLNKNAPPPPQSMQALESLGEQAPQLHAVAQGLSEQLQHAWSRAVTVRNQVLAHHQPTRCPCPPTHPLQSEYHLACSLVVRLSGLAGC